MLLGPERLNPPELDVRPVCLVGLSQGVGLRRGAGETLPGEGAEHGKGKAGAPCAC